MKDGRFRALSSDLEYWSGHRGRKIQYDGSRTPEFDQDENSLENIWVFDFLSVAVRHFTHVDRSDPF